MFNYENLLIFVLWLLLTWIHVTLHKKVFDLDHKYDSFSRIYNGKLAMFFLAFFLLVMILGYIYLKINLLYLILVVPLEVIIDRLVILNRIR